MSPELTRMQKYGPKTEVWSLGATLYEMSLGWLRGMPTRHVTENLKDNDPESRMLIYPFLLLIVCVSKSCFSQSFLLDVTLSQTFSHFTTERASIQSLRCAQEKLYVSADILELVQHLGNGTNMAPEICMTSLFPWDGRCFRGADHIKPDVFWHTYLGGLTRLD